MEKLSILIADDEVLMCEELQSLLEQYQDIGIVGICHDGDTALLKIKELHPDIVFLDINMPGKTGLQVAAILARQVAPPSVVFLTAFAEYAVHAFEVDAVDYVLKPFDETDIHRVITKLRKMRSVKEKKVTIGDNDESEKSDDYPRKFCVQRGANFEVIDIEHIQMFYAKDRLVFMQTVDGKHYNIKSTLNELNQKLDQKRFLQCHRNYIVNIDQIMNLENWFNRGYMLMLKGESKTQVPVSRLFVKQLKEHLTFE